MTDRELLEVAAKAAGIELRGWYDSPGVFLTALKYPRQWWDPLTDDGDALRLAVKFGIGVLHDDACVRAGWSRGQKVLFTLDGFGPWYWQEWLRDSGNDRQAATRRAIVRAAAEMANVS